jgi:uncharacterized protein YjbJ (UPF0337 family)
MGVGDKISGRVKKAAAELIDDPDLHRQGRREERKAEAREELEQARREADVKAEEVANLERKTS